mmetsp:Transcript_361/g.714  ORF Transcript_361/g.714 Transcript_361/m.714 type:complete len:227 (-) Transcript_361:70-750(-)|eukprot:CAMPEP_0184333850 /NCGR_PEP_ID=MMETSP1089-20130417/2805_1 /TAXON_ID=38269 ORGANISM="Gloeochaete wittrockiana, Strain SAG46.84" /NCGR_SAMPLE_ID=MMETSP1089 /ASSEMBLY_ACC=CAM_ASM_000445 /LENGTH=226 /DNA_ID=CAMNT_0026657907 /DNA_START=59 /DNA_END=739 /DNA_ORIENTATION=+
MSLNPDELTLFRDVVTRPYDQQAKFFLNAFWAEHSAEAETVWDYVLRFVALDPRAKEGSELDEFNSHRFLEGLGDALRVIEMRESLRSQGFDFKKRQMALIEYLLFRYNRGIKLLLSRPQGTNEELAKAQKALDAVTAEIDRIEALKNELERKSQGSGVLAMKAKNELNQLLNGDQTELNRAVLTAEAAVRRAQKLGGSAAQGHLWWIDRELTEKKKYQPRRNLAV